MTNPFRSTSDNPYDRPLVNGQLDTRGTQQDLNAVVYDPQTDSVNPAGVALIGSIMKQVDQRTLNADDVLDVLEPLLNRIDALERALDIKRDDTAKAIQSEIDGFMGRDDGPTKADLKRMMAAHTKRMEGVRK